MLGEGHEAHLLGKVPSRCKTSERKGRLHNSHRLWIYVFYKIALTGIFFKDTYRLPQESYLPWGKIKTTTHIYIYTTTVSFLETFYEYVTSISIDEMLDY